MNENLKILGLLLYCGVRLVIPLVITLLLAWGLRRLDAHWQAEAEAKASLIHKNKSIISQVKCWEMRGCSPQQLAGCLAYAQPGTPCWEVFSSNGHVRETCRQCKVFSRALRLAAI